MSKFNTPFFRPKKNADIEFNLLRDDKTPEALWQKLFPSTFVPSIIHCSDLFLLNEEGHFEKTGIMLGKSGDSALARGNYFVRDEAGFLRQIQVEQTENGTELSASRPVTIVEPAAPSFWTKVLAFFGHQASKDKMQTYNEAKEFADACRALAANAEYRLNLNPPAADRPEETLASTGRPVFQREQPEKKEREVRLKVEMPHAQFINHLHTAKHYTRDDFEAVLNNKNATYEDIVDAQVKLSTAELAHRLIALDNVDKDQMQHAFWTCCSAIKGRVENGHGEQIKTYINTLNSGDEDRIRAVRSDLSTALSTVWGSVQEDITRYRLHDNIVSEITDQMSEVKFRYGSDSRSLTELKNAAKYTVQDAKDFLGMGQRFPQDYKHAIGHLLEAKAAKMLLSKDDLNLDPYKSALEDIHKKVTDFVEKTYGDRIEKNFSAEVFGYKEFSQWNMERFIDEVNKDGLEKLLKFMNPEAKQQAQKEPEMKNEIEAAMAQNGGNPMVK